LKRDRKEEERGEECVVENIHNSYSSSNTTTTIIKSISTELAGM
jgi:hypothetical protein